MRATGAKVPPRRNAALLSANYPAATNFPLLSSRVPSPSPPLLRFICQESTCPVKKYSFRQRDTSAIRTNSNFLSLERERENGTMSFHYIISPIDRFIIDVQSIPVPFFFSFSFFFVERWNYPILGSTMKRRQCEYRCYHVAYYLSLDLSYNLANSAYAMELVGDGNADCSRRKMENIFILYSLSLLSALSLDARD